MGEERSNLHESSSSKEAARGSLPESFTLPDEFWCSFNEIASIKGAFFPFSSICLLVCIYLVLLASGQKRVDRSLK